jgi:hypothetical protein
VSLVGDIDREAVRDRRLRYPYLYGRCKGFLEFLADGHLIADPALKAAELLAVLAELEAVEPDYASWEE